MKDFPYKHISVLIMPTDFCNMNCVYCFNGRKTCEEKNIMSDSTLEKIFEITIPFYSEVAFIWHGGEPLSLGKAFYEKAIALQRKINKNNIPINNTIQTNLTLLDEEFADFLVKNNFHIGSSYDGITNDKTRHNTAQIMKGHEILKKSGGRNGFICVVQKENIDCLIEDYEWFKSHKINYNLNQYLTSEAENDELWVPAGEYIQKMCAFFDYWMLDTDCNIKVSYFERFLQYILLKEKELCCYNSCMGKHIGVHYDGRIFGCNRDFPEELCFGNVHEYTDIRQCFESQGFNRLLDKAIKRRNKCKENCELYDFCVGGCNSVALAGGNIELQNEYVCDTLKGVYHYIEKRVQEIMCNVTVMEKEKLNPHLLRYINQAETQQGF